MLPGYVSGFYTHDECHVDLNRLARYAGAALILESAVGLDVQVGSHCSTLFLLAKDLVTYMLFILIC